MANKQKQQFEHLKDKWTDLHNKIKNDVLSKHKDAFDWVLENVPKKQLLIGSLSGLLVATSPMVARIPGQHLIPRSEVLADTDRQEVLIDQLKIILPKEMRPLNVEEESKVSEILSRDFNMRVIPEIEGKRLERTYGYIGQEQHLARYPGDTMDSHFDNDEEAQKFTKYGMAPGLGAWGYFAPSKEQMTGQDELREKYYIAVPTFRAPDFLNRVSEYRDFFKYRKMLVVNPENGKAVVADIADAGPAEWTGKHLGGSPEVMRHLERVDGAQRGPVLYFFIDDQDNSVPLGPVEH